MFTTLDSNPFSKNPQELHESPTDAKHVLIQPRKEVVIIGGGIAGITAALYTARAGMDTTVFSGEYMSSTDYPGGQLMLTPSIDNYPGFVGSGEDLIATAQQQAENMGAKFVESRVKKVILDHSGRKNHHIYTENETHTARNVIIATGAIARKLNIVGEEEYYGRGVSSCATCDGAFFRDAEVAVVGGGDVAVEDALYMARHASKVYLIHRRDTLRANRLDTTRLLENPKIVPIWNSQVQEVVGNGQQVESIVISTPEGLVNLPVSAMFVAVGHDPQSELLMNTVIGIKDNGYVRTDGVRTIVAGVFIAGDVIDDTYRQAITAAASGAQAGMLVTRNARAVKLPPRE